MLSVHDTLLPANVSFGVLAVQGREHVISTMCG
jgi:hypothetical protein